jgi:hypothetical protein
MGRTTLLAKLAGDTKNFEWIYRFPANTSMPTGGVVPPTPVLAHLLGIAPIQRSRSVENENQQGVPARGSRARKPTRQEAA